MNPPLSSDYERLFLRSLDSHLDGEEHRRLSEVLEGDYKLQRESQKFLKIREMLLRKEADTFGPFFTEGVVNQLKNMHKQIDYQISFYFRKYQLVVVGIIMALIILNLVISDEFTWNSFLGIKEETMDDIINVDMYKEIIE